MGVVSPLLGCGAQTTGKTRTEIARIDDEHLAAALAILDAKLESAAVWSRKTLTNQLALDHDEERFDRSRTHLVVLSAREHGTATRIVLKNPTPDQLMRAATSLSEHAIAPPIELVAVEDVDWQSTWTQKHSDYRGPVRAIFAEAQNHGGSRVVYRTSYLQSVHTEQRLISQTQNIRSRAQRTRGGVVMGAWAGGEIASAHAEVSGQGGPALVSLTDDAIAKAATQTLSHLHARSAPSGVQEVLLSPATAAMLVYGGIAKSPTALRASGEHAVHIVDDPRSGFGATTFTAGGQRAVPHTLVGDDGSALPANARWQFDNRGTLTSEPSHVRMESGVEDLGALVAKVGTGVLLEGPELCRLDSRGERIAIVSSRGREIVNGRFTGRLFARMLTTAPLSAFLLDTRAIGRVHETVTFETNGIAGSAQAPHWLSSATVNKA